MDTPSSSRSVSPVLAPYSLAVAMRLELEGAVVAAEPVTARDLVEVFAESWLAAGPRRGAPGLRQEDLTFRLRPRFVRASENRCDEFIVEAIRPDGQVVRSSFGLTSVSHVALRASGQMIEEGLLREGDLFYYSLVAERESGSTPPPAPPAGGITIRRRATPFAYATVRLAPLLADAEYFGPEPDEGRLPVFYTRHALDKAEQVARRGEYLDPVVETGGMLVGPLCSCPDSGEMFAVILDVLEARDADATALTLTYSGKTLARIQAVMRARQSDPRTRSHRILGEAHGHSFMPSATDKRCQECSKAGGCARNTAFLSDSDLQWARAFFVGEPWTVHHIFGLDARGRGVDALFGQRRGTLTRRGYHVISAFDVEAGS